MHRAATRAVSAGLLVVALAAAGMGACGSRSEDGERVQPAGPTPVPTIVLVPTPDHQAMLEAVPALARRESALRAALSQSPPVMTLEASGLDDDRRLAQQLALGHARFVELAWSVPDHRPLRSEIVDVRPLAEAEKAAAPAACGEDRCYLVTMYSHAENMTTQATVNVDRAGVLDVSHRPETQPDLTEELQALAWQVALASDSVRSELGIDGADSALPGVERVYRRSACEQSRHLCGAPTFVLGDRALWVIVDLTDGEVVGMRWTGAGAVEDGIVTEGLLLGEYVDANYCREPRPLTVGEWRMEVFLTRSDGLRLTDVRFGNRPVLQSAKVVDWHVAYSREEAFGYSDAVGCPFFSSAAVPAMEPPRVEEILADGARIGYALQQDYIHPMWPAACMYNYRQRYELYDDGRFRVAVASNGGGCGNDGTYRPVIRVVPAGAPHRFAEWNGLGWGLWPLEQWRQQTEDTLFTSEGYQYRLLTADGGGYYIEPGRGQFGDGGRGDRAYVYVTVAKAREGEEELTTIGPCCNTDYRQGPEKYIEPRAEPTDQENLAIWYVPELKNDDTPGREYCWASASVRDGMYVTSAWPCYAGPMFVPIEHSPTG